MFKKWFGKKDESIRQLSQPEDLNVGDMFDMVDSFGLPKGIRGETFKITNIHTYEYQHEKEFEFQLEGASGAAYFMSIENEDGEKWINFMVKIERDEVEDIFDMDAFSEVFEEEAQRLPIAAKDESGVYERWLAPSYIMKSEWNSGYYHKGDYRNKSLSKFEEDDEGQALDSVSLVSDDDMFSVEIEIWENGTTDVFLCVTRPIADIKGLYGKT